MIKIFKTERTILNCFIPELICSEFLEAESFFEKARSLNSWEFLNPFLNKLPRKLPVWEPDEFERWQMSPACAHLVHHGVLQVNKDGTRHVLPASRLRNNISNLCTVIVSAFNSSKISLGNLIQEPIFNMVLHQWRHLQSSLIIKCNKLGHILLNTLQSLHPARRMTQLYLMT